MYSRTVLALGDSICASYILTVVHEKVSRLMQPIILPGSVHSVTDIVFLIVLLSPLGMNKETFQKLGSEVCSKDKQSIQIEIPTVVQRYSWDCGLACVCMVLRYLGIEDNEIYGKDHAEIDCGESVWTIDLCYLLQKYAIRNKLATTTLGVDKGYHTSSFYQGSFTRDENRVNKLFQEAESRGITLEKRCLEVDDIIDHLEGGNLVIVLVDWTYLECIWCDKSRISCLACFKGCSRCCNSYQGHYIVACGFDKGKKRIYYKNPSFNRDLCCSRLSALNKARKSYGTDQDTLFIYCH